MKNITWLFFLSALLFFAGCSDDKSSSQPRLTFNVRMLDSIKLHSDSSYEQPYKKGDWGSTIYFISKKDSTVTQLMKDSTGTIRRIVIEKGNRRIYTTQFYFNGQQQYKVNLDDSGQFDGAAEEYYPNGNLKRTGIYKHGLLAGLWKNYDEGGGYTFTQEYDENGQQTDKFKE